MNNNLSDIVKVDISLDTPVLDSTSFSNILIVGPEPACVGDLSAGDGYEPVMSFTSLKAVQATGIVCVSDDSTTPATVADAVGIGAAAAFSQNPKPSKIYMACRQKLGSEYISAEIVSSTSQGVTSYAIKVTYPSDVTYTLDDSVTLANFESKRASLYIKDLTALTYSKVSSTAEFDQTIADAHRYYTGAASEWTLTKELDTTSSGQAYSFERYGDKIIATSGAITDTAINEIKLKKNSLTEYGLKFKAVASGTEFVITNINTGDYESWTTTLDRALDVNGWYIVCPVGVEKADYDTFVNWIDAQTKMGCFNIPYAGYLEDDTDYAKCKSSLRCFGIYNLESKGQDETALNEKNKAENVAWCCKCLNYYPGQETWALKSLNGINPTEISSTDMQKIREGKNGSYKGVYSYYTTYASKDVTQGGMTFAGEWIDVIRGRDWLENEMQIRLLSILVANPKIPYTDEGIALIHNTMIATLKYAQQRGVVAPTEYDSNDEAVPGFETFVPLAVDISASQKASRKLEDCGFAARLAGAIHVVEVKGSLTYSLN